LCNSFLHCGCKSTTIFNTCKFFEDFFLFFLKLFSNITDNERFVLLHI